MKALDYHEATKHSWVRLHAYPHSLDFDNMPAPFKTYLDLERKPLPPPAPADCRSALAILCGAVDPLPGCPVSRDRLATILHFAAGITRKKQYGGREYLFRAASCTGALYHIEIYAVTGGTRDPAPGVYHYQPLDHSLACLRTGDFRGNLRDAAGGETSTVDAPVLLVLSSTFWRNAWKYQARAYRHTFWDGGCILANLLAIARAAGLRARLVMGFADLTVNALLGLDGEREAAVAVIALGDGEPIASPCAGFSPVRHRTEPLSEFEIDYPAIRGAHAASCLSDDAAVKNWRASAVAVEERTAPAPRSALPASPALADVILRRASTRRFARREIPREIFEALLHAAQSPIDSDFLPGDGALTRPYAIVHAVAGMAPGAYVYRAGRCELIREGDFRAEAGNLALGQDLAADAAANIYFLSDLAAVTAVFGDRGYRAAQMEGGLRGGRVYLAAYASGIGATGLTFLDDDVTAFFEPASAGRAVMFLIAVGRPGRVLR